MSTERRPKLYMSIEFGKNNLTVSIGPATGTSLSTTKAPIEFFKPDDAPSSALEFDTTKFLQLLRATAEISIRDADISPTEILGIGVTSQRQGLVLLDLAGQPLYAGPYRDMRAAKEGAEIDANALVDLWELTGHAPGVRSGWARLKWFASNKPDIYDRTRTACSIADWIILELTGELLMEETLAVESGFGMVATGDPTNVLTQAYNLADIQLPATCAPGTIVGKLKKTFADPLGIATSTPVVACGPDTQAGLIGLGIHQSNETGIISGWNTSCMRVTELPVVDDTRALLTGRHVTSNRWIMEGDAGDTGATYQWLLSLIYGSLDNVEVMESIDESLGKLKPGETGVDAFLGPSLIHSSNVTERMGGLMFPIPAINDPPDRFDIARSSLDSFAFAIRYNIERLNSFRGPAASISLGGGMAKTETFRTILTNVLDCEIWVAESGETTNLGTFSQVAASVGKGPSLAEIASERALELVKYEPDPTHSAIYDGLYSEWRHKERMIGNIDQ